MKTGLAATRPIGHDDFCRRYPAECSIRTQADERVALTDELWRQLVSVNDLVNRDIRPATDRKAWGARSGGTIQRSQATAKTTLS